VAYARMRLIFEQIFNKKQQYYKSDKDDPYPNNALIIFLMEFLILLISYNNDTQKCDEKKCGKN
jgi:hypothetical protein